jgi:hypothetical protein
MYSIVAFKMILDYNKHAPIDRIKWHIKLLIKGLEIFYIYYYFTIFNLKLYRHG